jgi:hypothetical protein
MQRWLEFLLRGLVILRMFVKVLKPNNDDSGLINKIKSNRP